MRLNPSRDSILDKEKRHAGTGSTAKGLLQHGRKLLRASESPAGFVSVALICVAGIFWYQASGGDLTDVAVPAPFTEIAAEVGDTVVATTPAAVTEPSERTVSLSLGKGETLIEALIGAGVGRSNAHQAVNELAGVADLRRLRPGQEIRLTHLTPDANVSQSTIVELRLRTGFDEEAVIRRRESTYAASKEPVRTISVTKLIEGTISDSLYVSAARDGLPAPVIVQAIRILSFDVDFEREIREGDRYSIYFERRYAPEFGDIEEGRILRISLGMRKRTLEGIYFSNEGSEGDYFDANGHSTRRALMKTPVDKAVMTSSYGRRKHPVLGYTRMHKGVDFRAPTGTPIMAAGDGVIERSSRYGSYGNYVKIRHNGNYKTAYAHLSKFGRGVKKGARVRQGQVIGYSGATGRVTAAHLHYEVMYNGRQTNPMTLKLPSGRRLKGQELETFDLSREKLMARVEQLRETETILLATATEPSGTPGGDAGDE